MMDAIGLERKTVLKPRLNRAPQYPTRTAGLAKLTDRVTLKFDFD